MSLYKRQSRREVVATQKVLLVFAAIALLALIAARVAIILALVQR